MNLTTSIQESMEEIEVIVFQEFVTRAMEVQCQLV